MQWLRNLTSPHQFFVRFYSEAELRQALRLLGEARYEFWRRSLPASLEKETEIVELLRDSGLALWGWMLENNVVTTPGIYCRTEQCSAFDLLDLPSRSRCRRCEGAGFLPLDRLPGVPDEDCHRCSGSGVEPRREECLTVDQVLRLLRL